MKLFIIVLGLAITQITSGQTIRGKVIDSKSKNPVIFANIGIIGTSTGTISDKNGNFEIDPGDNPLDSEIRFTMIGYYSETFKIKELIIAEQVIEMRQKPVDIDEVIVKAYGEEMKFGTKSGNRTDGFCGWGGTYFGRGHELGTLLSFEDNKVRIEILHLKLFKQSFDTSVFRLHIRDIKNGLPDNELLTHDIYLTVVKEDGWVSFDLNEYNLFFTGDIALSIEWIRVSGVNEDRLLKVNKSKTPRAVVLFHQDKRKGVFFGRSGSEAEWKRKNGSSPSFYITTKVYL